MNQKVLLVFLFSTLLVITVTHSLALYFSLYFIYPWLDIPMHFLGGASVAFALLLAAHSSLSLPKRYTTLLPVLLFVLCVGLIWELYEILIGVPFFEDEFALDMLSDLVMDLLGGMSGYVIGRSSARI